MSSPYHDVTPYLTNAGTVGTTTHVRQFHGVYPGVVVSNTDPLNQNRITMYVPQFLGTAQSGWAIPLIGILVAPQPGELVYAVFMGGDISQPTYINASQKQLNSTALATGTVPVITFSATQPANGQQGDLWYNTSQGSALSQFQNGAWVPYTFGTEAISASAITAKEIAAGALDAQSINAPSITAGTITAAQIINAPFPANSQTSIQGSQLSFSSAGGPVPVGTNTGGSALFYQTAPTSQTFNGLPGLREDQRHKYKGRYGDISGTFTVPAGVTTISVQMWGGGGGGDGNTHGGGGGEYIHEPNYQVSPGNILNYTVGNGGVAGGGVGGGVQATNGNPTTLSGGNVQAKPTSLIAYGGGAVGGAFQPAFQGPSYGGGRNINFVSGDHGEAPAGNGGYNSTFQSTNTAVNVAPGGGGGAGGPTGPGQDGGIATGGLGTSGAGGAGNSPGGSGGTANVLAYDSGQNDYFSQGNDGASPGGGGSGGWNGANAEYSIFGGNGAGGQIVLNWNTSSNVQMIGSIAASSGTDTANNAYPSGFAGQTFQLANQASAPSAPTGAALLFGAGGRPWAHAPSGIGGTTSGLPVACSTIFATNSQIHASGSAVAISSLIAVPANDANAGSGYRIMAYGSGNTADGATSVDFDLYFGSFTGPTTAQVPTPSGTFFAWDITGIIVMESIGVTGTAAAYLRGTLTCVTGGANFVLAAQPSAGYTIDTTQAQALQIFAGMGLGSTSSFMNCDFTIFERIGA